MAAALLEDSLDEILKAEISKAGISSNHMKDMFDLSGPLSSFSSKSLVCYGFGFISKRVFDDLTKIRKLRNEFAHSHEKVDFLSPEIEDIVSTINCCIEASKDFKGNMFKGRAKSTSVETKSPKDWEIRSKGFMKYTKAVFCIGIQLLRAEIMKHHPANKQGLSKE